VDAGGTLPLPATLPDGLQTLEVGGETFRVLAGTTAAGERFAVAQEAGFRDEIARDAAFRSVMPFLILMPVLLLIVADLVRKMFRPIAALSKEIDQRAEQELHPVEDRHLPVEVRPFAVAINRLLARVGQSMESQRRFVADAAHELRSPLTALKLQLQAVRRAGDYAARRAALEALGAGIERATHLVEQLLTLARSDPAAGAPSLRDVDLSEAVRLAVADVVPIAVARAITLELDADAGITLRGDATALRILARNLVDNAVRYSPGGARVEVRLSATPDGPQLQVDDSGPGIPAAERSRVFDRFYRRETGTESGSGLGLAIVKAIAEQHGARVALADSPLGGLRVTVRFAASASP
jgi:two-component system OmpR family sensor kinase